MAVIKCKMCGGDLVLTDGSCVAECEYCGSLQTVPNADNEKKLTLFGRANRLRANCEFDKAFGVYEVILADFPEEAEAYWGLVLCKYGIEYVDDPASGKKIPTCHRSSYNSIMEDSDYEQTLENADPIARKVYREEAKQIEQIRKGILEVSAQEAPYDIFICYKETTAEGQRTLDSVLAQDIYDALTEKKYRVFFSRITLEDKLGQEYEPYIFAALNSAKVMLVIGTDYEHFNAVWVRNEWSRYLKLMETDKQKHLIPCFKDVDAYDMPKEFAKLQAQDLGKLGAIQDLLRGLEKLLSPTAGKAEQKSGVDVSAQLEKGQQALQDGEWAVAANRFDLALVANAECAQAYVGKLMAQCKVKRPEDLAKGKRRWDKSGDFEEAMTYADEKLKQELAGYRRKSNRILFTKRLISMTLLTICIAAALITGWRHMDAQYDAIISDFYGETRGAENTMRALEEISWFRKVDPTTAYLICWKTGGAGYPEYGDITELEIPDGIKTIPSKFLAKRENITKVILPDSVTSIGNCAFQGCEGLQEITIPDSVTGIGKSAFEGCSRLTSAELGSNVKEIGADAFKNCSNLQKITIPDSVTRIGGSAFRDCTGLTAATLSSNLMEVEGCTFLNCSSLQQITIPDSVTVIGTSAFEDCTALRTADLGNGIEKIEASAFDGCSSLQQIAIPITVTYVGVTAFARTTAQINCEAPSQPDTWKGIWNLRAEGEIRWGVSAP